MQKMDCDKLFALIKICINIKDVKILLYKDTDVLYRSNYYTIVTDRINENEW